MAASGDVRRAVVAAHVALPHRHQRLPRRARGARAAGAPDGRRPAAVVSAVGSTLPERPRPHWLEPVPDAARLPADADPAELAVLKESIRLAFVAALQHLPPKQRAALLLTEVLGWSAAEVADSLEATVASVNSALQRAARHAGAQRRRHARPHPTPNAALIERYVEAFHRYDVDALTALLHDDAIMTMPPCRHVAAAARRASTSGCVGRAWAATARASCRSKPAAVPGLRPVPPGRPPGMGPRGPRTPGRPDRWLAHLPRHGDAVPALRAGPPRLDA